jgi:hypothetical protein
LYGKPVPTRNELSRLVVNSSFRKQEYGDLKNFPQHSFSDGVLESLSIWLEQPPHEFISLTFDEPTHLREAAFDSFQLGWDGIHIELGKHREYVIHERSQPTTEREVRRAVQEWQMELGWQLMEEAEVHRESDREKLLETALRRLHLQSESDLPDQIVSLWAVNPNIIQVAYDLTEKRCGMSCLIPVSENAFTMLRSGRLTIVKIRPEDVRQNSSFAVLLASTEYSFRLKPKYRRASTRAVFGCFLAQMNRCFGENKNVDHAILGLVESRLSRERLDCLGFQSVSQPQRRHHFSELQFATANCESLVGCLRLVSQLYSRPRKKRPKL